jgi:hypothetical protein
MAKELNENLESKYDKAETAAFELLEEVASNIDNNIEKRLNKARVQIVKKYFYDDFTAAVPYFILILNVVAAVTLYVMIDDFFLLSLATILLLIPIFAYIENKDTQNYLKKITGEHSSIFDDKQINEILLYLEKQIFGFNFKHRYLSYIYVMIIPIFGIIAANITQNKLYFLSIILIPILGLISPLFIKREV